MPPKKASMNLKDAIASNPNPIAKDLPEKPSKENIVSSGSSQKKRAVPFYVPSNLHDAMQSICFLERHDKMNMQKMILEGLGLLFEKKGYPAIDEIIDGKKNIKL